MKRILINFNRGAHNACISGDVSAKHEKN